MRTSHKLLLFGGRQPDIIRSIFADGTDGFYFDFSKTDRLFQDQAGTLANDAGENIHTALDAHSWAGMTAQQATDASAEKVGTNPSFDSNITGWTTASGNSTVAWDADGGNGAALVTINGSSGGIADAQVFSFTVGALYRVRVRMRSGTFAGQLAIRAAATTLAVATLTASYADYDAYFVAGAADAVIDVSRNTANTGTLYVDSISIKQVPGNYGTQATAAAQPKWQTGGLARFDGSDDNLLTTLNPAASFSMLFKGKITSASKVVMGSRATTDTRALIGTDASGLLAGGVGSDSTATIKGGSDIRGTTGVGALVYSASGVVLYWNGLSIYSGPLNGSPNTTIPLRLGAFNDNGTAGTFADADIYHDLAIQKALTAAEIAAITSLWGTS